MHGKNREKRLLQKAVVLFVAIVGALILFFKGVSHYVERSSRLKVTFQTSNGEKGPFFLSIASTQKERQQGLMYRSSLPQDEGMLFIFHDEQPRSFWMKNVYIPLDIIFLDKDLTVQGIAENAEIMTTSPRTVPGAKSKYVIELIGGKAKEVGIAKGTKAVLHGPIPEGLPDYVESKE